jgi:uncharacterized protein
MKSGRRFVASITCLAAIWLVLCGAIGIFAVEGALHPARLSLLPADQALAQSVAERDHAAMTSVSLQADDGAVLRAWLFALPRGNGDAVILLHGMADNRAGMLGNAEMLLHHGFSVLLPDARAHGQSGGLIAAYGVNEAGDLRHWFAWLRQTVAPHCIDGLGDSMGAAILLESLAVEPHFCAVVAESPFSSFREASYDRLGQWFHAGPWLGRTLLRPTVPAGFLYAGFRYGIDLENASPESAVAGTRVPVLLIHGLADTNLPPRHSELIKAANPTVELWEPEGAEHCGAASTAPEEYERRVVRWFDAHRQAQNSAREIKAQHSAASSRIL